MNLQLNRTSRAMPLGVAMIFAATPLGAVPASALSITAPLDCAPVSAATIDAQFKHFTDTWATGEAGEVAALFAPDAVLLATVSNTPRVTNAQVRDYFEHFLKGRPVARIDSSTTHLGCNLATRVGTWTVALTDPSTKAETHVRARYSFVYKFDRGRWWIGHLHSSKMPEAQK